MKLGQRKKPNLKILFFSFKIVRNSATEELFGNGIIDRRILRIERYCNCKFEVIKSHTGINKELFFGINIMYDDYRGNHLGCMQMLLMLLKVISVARKIFFQIHPQRIIIKDYGGLYHSFDMKKHPIPWRSTDTPNTLMRSGHHMNTPRPDTPMVLRDMKNLVSSKTSSSKEPPSYPIFPMPGLSSIKRSVSQIINKVSSVAGDSHSTCTMSQKTSSGSSRSSAESKEIHPLQLGKHYLMRKPIPTIHEPTGHVHQRHLMKTFTPKHLASAEISSSEFNENPSPRISMKRSSLAYNSSLKNQGHSPLISSKGSKSDFPRSRQVSQASHVSANRFSYLPYQTMRERTENTGGSSPGRVSASSFQPVSSPRRQRIKPSFTEESIRLNTRLDMSNDDPSSCTNYTSLSLPRSPSSYVDCDSNSLGDSLDDISETRLFIRAQTI